MEASKYNIQNSWKTYFPYFNKFLKKYKERWKHNAQMCNFQDDIRWNEGCARKKTNLRLLTHDTIHPPRQWICLFFICHISTFFILKFYTHRHNILVYLHNFFQIFLKPKSLNFDLFSRKGLHGSREPNVRSRKISTIKSELVTITHGQLANNLNKQGQQSRDQSWVSKIK